MCCLSECYSPTIFVFPLLVPKTTKFSSNPRINADEIRSSAADSEIEPPVPDDDSPSRQNPSENAKGGFILHPRQLSFCMMNSISRS